jgi:Lipopolysaccharide-assembly, LptC-related
MFFIRVWFAGLLVVVTACAPPSRQAAEVSPSPGASPLGAKATPTPVPGRATQNSGGGKYVTLSESTLDPGSSQGRVLYDVIALKSVVTSTFATLDRPHITFHERSGKVLVADAPEAKITRQDKSVLMTGGVHAKTQDGSLLTCDSLRYDGRTETLRGDGHVTLASPSGANNYMMTGDHIYGDVRWEHVQITNGK